MNVKTVTVVLVPVISAGFVAIAWGDPCPVAPSRPPAVTP